METQNLTLRLPKALLKRAKQVAAERDTTVTGLVIEGLTRVTSCEEAYQAAWERQKALMQAGHILRQPSEPMSKREAAHELAAIELHQAHQVSFWDAMVLKSALELGCSIVWSEDLNPGQRFETLEVRNPL